MARAEEADSIAQEASSVQGELERKVAEGARVRERLEVEAKDYEGQLEGAMLELDECKTELYDSRAKLRAAEESNRVLEGRARELEDCEMRLEAAEVRPTSAM